VNLPSATKSSEIIATTSNIGKYKSVDPVSHMKLVDNEMIHYWTKPMDKVLNASIATRLFGGATDDEMIYNNINKVDLE